MKPTRLEEDTTCFLCDYWWIIFLFLILVLALYLTRGLWVSHVFPPTPTPTPTMTPSPTVTLTPTPTNTLTPTPTATIEPTLNPGTGDVQVMLAWDGRNDLDLHVIDPEGFEIFYGQSSSPSGGELDIDSNAGCSSNMRSDPIENFYWPTGGAPRGEYRIVVWLYKPCQDTSQTPFTVRLLVDGEVQDFSGSVNSSSPKFALTEFSR